MERDHRIDPAAAHWDVAGYALGVLDPAEADRFERHLTSCASCATQLERLLPASALLADVEPESVRQSDDPAVLDRLAGLVTRDRRRSRRRSRALATATAALAAAVAGGAALAAGDWFAGGPGPAGPGPPAASGAPGTGGSEPDSDLLTTTDAGTGVAVEAVLTSVDWGTHVEFTLWSLAGPRECKIVLVYADGSERIAGSWLVPVDGYGTAEQPMPLRLQAAVGGDRSDLVELRVVEISADGSNSPLVTLPL